jgi:excisionase family DNA binding protein
MKTSLSVNEFCEANSISRFTFYQLLKRGEGPAIMKVGRRTLVSHEASEAWRRAMERNARTSSPLQAGP